VVWVLVVVGVGLGVVWVGLGVVGVGWLALFAGGELVTAITGAQPKARLLSSLDAALASRG
jgi:hypothetical protein